MRCKSTRLYWCLILNDASVSGVRTVVDYKQTSNYYTIGYSGHIPIIQ